jgi:hypothetical protein
MTVYLGTDRQRTTQHLTATHVTVSELTNKIRGSRAEDFFALKNPTASAGFEPKASTLPLDHRSPQGHHSPPSNVDVKNEWSHTSTPPAWTRIVSVS